MRVIFMAVSALLPFAFASSARHIALSKASLILADGTVFEGKCFGAEGTVIGEIVFTTAMTGYLALEVSVDVSLAAEIRGNLAVFPYHIPNSTPPKTQDLTWC